MIGQDAVLVPREPTDDMRRAFRGDGDHGFLRTTIQVGDFDDRYRAMLAAAPSATPASDEAVGDAERAFLHAYREAGGEVRWLHDQYLTAGIRAALSARTAAPAYPVMPPLPTYEQPQFRASTTTAAPAEQHPLLTRDFNGNKRPELHAAEAARLAPIAPDATFEAESLRWDRKELGASEAHVAVAPDARSDAYAKSLATHLCQLVTGNARVVAEKLAHALGATIPTPLTRSVDGLSGEEREALAIVEDFHSSDRPIQREAALRASATIARALRSRLAGAKVQDGDLLALQRFADAALDEWWDRTFDGGEMQDLGVACGLLEEFTQPEPCGDDCACADNGADFPTTCIRRTPTLRRAILATHHADAAAAAQSENTTRENDNGC